MTNSNTSIPAPSRRLGTVALGFAFLATVAGLYACAPKITKVDAAYTMPEGVFNPNAQMLVWRDEPTTAYVYDDVVPADPDSTDVLTSTRQYERYTPNVLHGMIFDKTMANDFQLFRRESDGGVRQFVKFTAPRTRQWLPAQLEAFHFVDLSPSGYAPASYVARGVVAGIVNAQSPLTNLATLPVAPVANIDLKAAWWTNRDGTRGPVFSSPKIKLKWGTVPGAARYLLNVYEFRTDIRSEQERILSGTPAPFYDGQSSDIFFGYVPGNVNFMFVGDSSRTDITTITARPLASGAGYYVRLTAFDATGHMIAMTMGDTNPLVAYTTGYMGIVRNVAGNNTYMLYRFGATTARDTTPPIGPGGGGDGGGLGL